MIHQLMPWRELTRSGIPALKVVRRAIQFGEVTVPVGATLDPELIPPHIRQERLRQFYESRRLEPVDPPPSTQQYYREQFERAHGGGQEVPVAPIQPVASRIVAGELPAVDVPVEPEPERRPDPKRRK